MGTIWEGVIMANQMARKVVSLEKKSKYEMESLKTRAVTETTHLKTDMTILKKWLRVWNGKYQ